VREAVTLQEIKGSEPYRLSLARRLLDLGADPNRAEVTMDFTMPVFTERVYTQLRLTRTPLQLAASCGFVKMVKLLVAKGAEPDLVIGERSSELLELPLMLAVRQALLPGGNIETVQELLKAGASLEDCLDQSVLHTLYNMRPKKSPYGTLSDDFPDWEDWLRIVEMFLDYGAATQTSEENWHKVLAEGCLPGNLRYCELLGKARSVSELPPVILIRMLRTALREMTKPRGAAVQDTELFRWVLQRYLDTEGRLRVPKDILRAAHHQAYRQRLNRIVDVMGEFLSLEEAPTVSGMDKEKLLWVLTWG
jgi:ankyrin repeat protein